MPGEDPRGVDRRGPTDERRRADFDRETRVRRAATARSWSVVLSPVDAELLQGFDVVVAGGTTVTGATCVPDEAIRHLQRHASLVLAHVPLASAVPGADRALPADWLRAPAVPDRPAPVDPRHPGWVQRTLARVLAVDARGLDGLYLDDLDLWAALHGRTPGDDVALALVRLLTAVREALPHALLVAQDVQPDLGPEPSPGTGWGDNRATDGPAGAPPPGPSLPWDGLVDLRGHGRRLLDLLPPTGGGATASVAGAGRSLRFPLRRRHVRPAEGYRPGRHGDQPEPPAAARS